MKPSIDPWGSSQIKDYDKLMKEFGIEKFKSVPKPHHYFSRNIIYGHKDIQRIGNAINNKKPFVLLTGMMPSGIFHIGHKVVADQIIYWQSLGAKVYIVVADVESYLARNIPFKKAKEIAIDQYILNYIALGLKPRNTKIYFQSEGPSNYQTLSKVAAKGTTINQIKGLYGQPTLKNILAPLTQAADILYPQLELGPIPTIVPVGVDQLPHLNLTRDIANKLKDYKFIPPSATFNKFLPGLQGRKMSSSEPSSHIALTDNEETIKTKIHKYEETSRIKCVRKPARQRCKKNSP